MRSYAGFGAVVVCTIAAACSSGTTRFAPPDGGASDAATLRDAGQTLGDGAGPQSGYCSGDLRSIVDANGAIIETCPNDQGCANGQCVAACDAATASKGNIGCTFVTSTPSFYPAIKPPCYAVFIANAWTRDANLTVSRGGASYDVTKFGRIADTTNVKLWQPVPTTGLPPGKVAVLFMSHDPASKHPVGADLTCPFAPAVTASTAVHSGGAAATGKGTAFTIRSDFPVSAYDILPFGGAESYLPSAQLLMPVSALGTNFVVAQPPASNNGASGAQEAHWLQIIAASDNTEVSIVPVAPLPSGTGVSAAPANMVSKYVLSAGEFIQWQNTTDISGSVVSSTLPIAVAGGQTYLHWDTKTSNTGAGESAHQLVMPVSALGSEYAIAPIKSRLTSGEESMSYRIVGAVDGTTLTFDPPINGAPTQTLRGNVGLFETTGAFTVKSQDDQHPFLIAQLLSGAVSSEGDEEYVNVIPPAQFLNHYVFFTDPSYSNTTLSIVRVKGKNGFADVEIGCSGPVTGWKSAGGSYEYTTTQLVSAGKGVGSCANGPQTAKSDAPFGIVVWGTSRYASYGYPAGGNAAGINQVVVPAAPR